MKNILEFIPLVVFFIAYKKAGIIIATICLVVTSLISFLYLTISTKKVAMVPLVSAVILGVFGFLTWYLDNPLFIKIKPTIVNIIFGIIFVGGYFLKKPVFKYLFDQAFHMKDSAWGILSLRWGIFFFVLAIINEFVWRSYSEEFWVNFKVFGFMPITIIFTLSQLPFMLRNQIQQGKK